MVKQDQPRKKKEMTKKKKSKDLMKQDALFLPS
jgi:hypothetical protein